MGVDENRISVGHFLRYAVMTGNWNRAVAKSITTTPPFIVESTTVQYVSTGRGGRGEWTAFKLRGDNDDGQSIGELVGRSFLRVLCR